MSTQKDLLHRRQSPERVRKDIKPHCISTTQQSAAMDTPFVHWFAANAHAMAINVAGILFMYASICVIDPGLVPFGYEMQRPSSMFDNNLGHINHQYQPKPHQMMTKPPAYAPFAEPTSTTSVFEAIQPSTTLSNDFTDDFFSLIQPFNDATATADTLEPEIPVSKYRKAAAPLHSLGPSPQIAEAYHIYTNPTARPMSWSESFSQYYQSLAHVLKSIAKELTTPHAAMVKSPKMVRLVDILTVIYVEWGSILPLIGLVSSFFSLIFIAKRLQDWILSNDLHNRAYLAVLHCLFSTMSASTGDSCHSCRVQTNEHNRYSALVIALYASLSQERKTHRKDLEALKALQASLSKAQRIHVNDMEELDDLIKMQKECGESTEEAKRVLNEEKELLQQDCDSKDSMITSLRATNQHFSVENARINADCRHLQSINSSLNTSLELANRRIDEMWTLVAKNGALVAEKLLDAMAKDRSIYDELAATKALLAEKSQLVDELEQENADLEEKQAGLLEAAERRAHNAANDSADKDTKEPDSPFEFDDSDSIASSERASPSAAAKGKAKEDCPSEQNPADASQAVDGNDHAEDSKPASTHPDDAAEASNDTSAANDDANEGASLNDGLDNPASAASEGQPAEPEKTKKKIRRGKRRPRRGNAPAAGVIAVLNGGAQYNGNTQASLPAAGPSSQPSPVAASSSLTQPIVRLPSLAPPRPTQPSAQPPAPAAPTSLPTALASHPLCPSAIPQHIPPPQRMPQPDPRLIPRTPIQRGGYRGFEANLASGQYRGAGRGRWNNDRRGDTRGRGRGFGRGGPPGQ